MLFEIWIVCSGQTNRDDDRIILQRYLYPSYRNSTNRANIMCTKCDNIANLRR